MPELPEVEAVRRLLERRVVGARVRDVSVVAPKILKGSEPSAFAAALRGATLESVRRRGKYLIVRLRARAGDPKPGRAEAETELDLVAHLNMRGSVRIEPAASAPGKWLCLEFALDNGEALRYYDVWGWGEFRLLAADSAASAIPALAEMGPEPDSVQFTLDRLAEGLRGRKSPIKPALMSQRLVAGLGNIDADEVLNRAGVHPGRTCASLDRIEVGRLYNAIVETINEATARGGAAVERIADESANLDDLNEVYEPKVYDRAGQPCPRCGRPLIKYKLQGRGTTFCPYCQPDADGHA